MRVIERGRERFINFTKSYNSQFPDSKISLTRDEKKEVAKDIMDGMLEDIVHNLKEKNFILKKLGS